MNTRTMIYRRTAVLHMNTVMRRTLMFTTLAALFALMMTAQPADAQLAESASIRLSAPFHSTGTSVAIDGTTAVVSSQELFFNQVLEYPYCFSPSECFNDPRSYPVVFVYEYDGSDWVQTTKLTDDDGFDQDSTSILGADMFGQISDEGTPLAVDGDTIVVGAYGDDDNGRGAGAVFVFVRDDNGTPGDTSDDTWPTQTKLTPSDPAAQQHFGAHVDIDGDTVVVSAGLDDDNGNLSGAMYIFERSGSVWTQKIKITEPSGAAGNRFGQNVGLAGDTVVTGGWQSGPYMSCIDSGAGRTYVFERSGGTWSSTPDAVLAPGDEAGCTTAGFGWPVAIGDDGDTIAVGAEYAGMSAPGLYDGPGAMYVFERGGGSWSEAGRFTPSNVVNNAVVPGFGGGYYFPWSLSVSGDTIVGSASLDDTGCPATRSDCNAGAAFLFERSAGSWSETQKIMPGYELGADPIRRGLGPGVAVSGDTVLVGATAVEPWDQNDFCRVDDYVICEIHAAGGFIVYKPDMDEDGMTNDFESGFGGTVPEESLTVTNPETGDEATATGSAADGATIFSGSFEIELPAGSSVDTGGGASEIVVTLDATLPARAEVSGADLDGGTKSITMPFDGDAPDPAVCIDDSPEATIDSILVGGACSATLIEIPADEGESETQGAFTVTRLSDSPARVKVDGLSHTALATVDLASPVVGEVTSAVEPVEVGTSVQAMVTFFDGDSNTSSATIDWGDGATSAGTIDSGGTSASGDHTYTEPGVYTLSVTLADSDGNTGTGAYQFVVVYDPDGGFVTGGGWIDSPEGAYTANSTLTGRAHFGFVSKYKNGADTPEGDTNFRFNAGGLHFESTSYDWLVVAGYDRAKFKGSGVINDSGNYGFMLTATDDDPDTFRIKIWDKNAGDGVVYDNKLGSDDYGHDGTELGGGNIKVHKK